jgi:hypothetical protein
MGAIEAQSGKSGQGVNLDRRAALDPGRDLPMGTAALRRLARYPFRALPEPC